MFFSITPAPIFRGPPIQARSVDVNTSSKTTTVTISKPVPRVIKRRISHCLTLSGAEEIRPSSDAYALSRENRNLEEKFKSVLQVDPGYVPRLVLDLSNRTGAHSKRHKPHTDVVKM